MPGADRRRPRLGLWWAGAAVVLAGLAVFVGLDRPLVGGLLMAAGFVVWAVLRVVLRDRPASGLVVRSIGLDVVTQLGLALNVAGAVLLTVVRMDWRPLAVMDLLLLIAFVAVVRRERRRLRVTGGSQTRR